MAGSPNNKGKGLRVVAELSHVRTRLEMREVHERLNTAARRGKLAGYEKTGQNRFLLDAFGTPFDLDLNAQGHRTKDITTIRFTTRMRRKLPIVFAIVLLLTIEPGRYFTDQLIPGSWGWIDTMYWYYPLTILPLPFLWPKLLHKSRESGRKHAREQIEKVARLCDGRVEKSDS